MVTAFILNLIMRLNKFESLELDTLFFINGFKRIRTSIYSVKFEKDIRVILIYDPREYICTLWIAADENDSIEITNDILKIYYHSDLKLDNLAEDEFLRNVLAFLRNDGKSLFEAGYSELLRIKEIRQQLSLQYTNELITQQNINLAEDAWKKQNYHDTIYFLEKVNPELWPESLRRKYEISKIKYRRY